MLINQIRLTQFKLFDELVVDTKPLTILTGANSSGKSSLLNALATIAQTEQPYTYPFEFVPNGINCSLGSYKDVVNGHNTKKSFAVGFSATHRKNPVCLDAAYRYSPRGDHILLRRMSYRAGEDGLDIDWYGHDKGYLCRLRAESLLRMQSDANFQQVIDSFKQFAVSLVKKHDKKRSDAKIARLMRRLTLPGRLPVIHISGRVPPRDFSDKIRRNPAGSYLLSDLQSFMQEFQRTVGYVGPVRAIPLRYYTPDRPHTKIDPSGANCAQLLRDWQTHHTKRFAQVGSLLRELELTRSLHPQSDTDEILKMIVQPFGHRESVNLADVGFGVSQALPFVVADVALPDESVLLVNQPEVHLHPTGQAQLANYFVGRLKKRQYLVETHSEYIINRLRVLAQQGKLDPSQVAIVFFASDTRTKSLVKKYDIQLLKDGSLEGAPKQFFQTYYADSFALAMGTESK